MLLNWLLFVTLLMCLHFGSVPSAYVTVLAYVVLFIGYLSSFLRQERIDALVKYVCHNTVKVK